MITRDELMDRLSYDQETGLFHWVKPLNPLIKAGDLAGSTRHISRYVNIGFGGRYYKAHRLAWLWVYGEWPNQHIDHINGDRTDNRIANLRDVSRTINNQNIHGPRRDNKSTGILGVHKHASKWRGQLQANGKLYQTGVFATPQEAQAAYLELKRRLHEGCTI